MLQTNMQIFKWFVNDAIRKFNYLKRIVILKLNSIELHAILICRRRSVVSLKGKNVWLNFIISFYKRLDLKELNT